MKVNLSIYFDSGQVLKLWWLENTDLTTEEVLKTYQNAFELAIAEKRLINLKDSKHKVYVIDTTKVICFEINVSRKKERRVKK